MPSSTVLLRYEVTTDPFPLQASNTSGLPNTATLQVVASNPNPLLPVNLKGLGITVPIGQDSSDLTAIPPTPPVPPDGWTLANTKKGSGTIEYVFQPKAGHGIVGRKGLAFAFDVIQVNSVPGTSQVTIKEGSPGDPTKELLITKFPNGWGAVTFWLDPPDIPYQESTTLNWSGPTGATYSIEYVMGGEIINIPAEGDPALGSQGQYPAQGKPPLTLDRTTVFNLIVNETIGEHSYKAQEQKIGSVELPVPVINLFQARMDDSLFPTLILEWATDYADECEISGSPYQLKPSSPEDGFKFPLSPVSPLLSFYTLSAINDTGTATSDITVEWNPSIPTPQGLPPNLYVLCVSPDARLLYAGQTEGGAPNFGGPALCAFNVKTLQPSTQGGSVPFDNGFSFSSEGSLIYGAGATGTLHVLDSGTLKVIKEVSVGGSFGGVAASPDGKFLYLADSQVNAIRVIDASSFQPVGKSAPLDHPPYGIAVSPDGSRVYATLLTSLDPSAGGTVVEFAATADVNNPLEFVGQVHMDYSPFGIAVSPDGQRVFVVSGVRDWSNKVIPIFNFAVMVLDASLQPAGNPIPVGFSPFGVAISPDGTGLFVSASGVLSAFAPTFSGGITG